MRKAWVVAKREFVARVKTKQFVIATAFGPALLAVLFVAPILLQQNTRAKRIVVVDAAEGGLGERVEAMLTRATRNGKPDGEHRYVTSRVEAVGRLEQVRDSLVALVDRRELGDAGLDGILLVTDEVLATDTLHYLGGNVGSPSEMGNLSRTVREAVLTERLTQAGISPAVLMETVKPIELVTAKVSQGTLTGQSGAASFLLAYVMSFVLYMALLIYGVQVMTSTVEEKTNRINEVLVSSLRPFELMLGKVLGVGSVALLQLSIWAGATFGLTQARGGIAGLAGMSPEAVAALPIPEISLGLLVVFLVFFVLGFFFFSAAYAAVGSTCNTVQETQMASLPVTLVVVSGLFVMFKLLGEPNGQLAHVLSLVPPLAPFVTPARYSLSPLPLPELLLSVAVTALGVLAMAWVAGRIYRVGILMYGKRATVREIVRWIRAG
jgi:ABC-2 type transport system permease protein